MLKRFGPTLSCIALGGVLMLWGDRLGGRDAVFMKAVNICLECIGIG